MDVVQQLERVSTDGGDAPRVPVRVYDCGELRGSDAAPTAAAGKGKQAASTAARQELTLSHLHDGDDGEALDVLPKHFGTRRWASRAADGACGFARTLP